MSDSNKKIGGEYGHVFNSPAAEINMDDVRAKSKNDISKEPKITETQQSRSLDVEFVFSGVDDMANLKSTKQ